MHRELMARGSLAGGVWITAIIMFFCLTTAASPSPKGAAVAPLSARQPHPGVLGLPWGTSAALAKTHLSHTLKLVEETEAKVAPYDTLEQRWSGDFGEMPTADIDLKFFRGKLFYAMVTLATKDAGSASKVFEDARGKMTAVYGPGRGYRAPLKLASKKAILDHVVLDGEAKRAMPLLWNDVTAENKDAAHWLKDLQIRTKLWDPFVGWKFSNDVVVQVFIFEQFTDQKPGTVSILKPLWIFAKRDVFDEWKRAAERQVVAPRDF